MRADFVGFRAVELGLRGGDVFQAIAVLLQLVLGFGLSRGGAGFRDFFGTIASLDFSAPARDCCSAARNSRSSKVIRT